MAGHGYNMYEHIVKVLLQAEIDSPIYTLLQDADITTLRRLRQYLKKPGLEDKQWRDIEDGDTMKDFSGDMKEDLQAIASYLDWLQNHSGPTDGSVDITTTPRRHVRTLMPMSDVTLTQRTSMNTTIQLLRHPRTAEHS